LDHTEEVIRVSQGLAKLLERRVLPRNRMLSLNGKMLIAVVRKRELAELVLVRIG
jgi:hypothetical protein